MGGTKKIFSDKKLIKKIKKKRKKGWYKLQIVAYVNDHCDKGLRYSKEFVDKHL